MLEDLKGYLTGFAVRWVLKTGGGFFLSYGVTNDNVTIIVTSIVSVLIGLIVSLIQHKQAVAQTPTA